MEAVFERILQISLSGSVIVLAVLVLRLMLRKAPRRAVCLLWMLAVLRLLVPFEIQSDWSLQPEPVEFAPPTVQTEYFDSGTSHVRPANPEILGDAVEYPLEPLPEKQAEPKDLLPWLWLAGVGLLAAHGALSYLRMKRRVRGAVILEEGVWVCAGLDTAFVLGFFRPQIYLPVLEAEERELVLLHERQHIRRLDHWWKLAAFAAVSLHWFNPLAWVTYVLMCRDMELACDQETVRGMDNEKRKAYSAALLNCAARRSGIAACPVAFGEISVKERIKMVLNYQKPGFWVTLVALIAAVAVGFFLLTSPKELTDLEKCEQALKQWQGMDSIHLHSESISVGDYIMNETARVDYWASGGNAVERVEIEADSGTVMWHALLNGKLYCRSEWPDRMEAGQESGSIPWETDTLRPSWSLPWILALDWDDCQITHLETLTTEEGADICVEVYRPKDGVHRLVFSFAGDELKEITRTYDRVVLDELDERDGLMASVCTDLYSLVGTDRESVEKQMNLYGPVPELVQLYSQLDALQAKESVHLIIDMEIDSNYDGWDTCRQEFLRSGNLWYRNFDYQTSAGALTTSYFYDGWKVFAQELSENPDLADRTWAQIKDQGFGELSILNRDWSKLEVLKIEKQRDGSVVITLQGDLTPTEDTTYYEKTYEFYMDAKGKLTGMVSNYHASKYINEWKVQGTFEIRGKDTVEILETSNETIQERIMAIRKEAIG